MAKKKSRFKQFAKGAALGAAEQSAEEIEEFMKKIKERKAGLGDCQTREVSRNFCHF